MISRTAPRHTRLSLALLCAMLIVCGCDTPTPPPGFGLAVDGHPVTDQTLDTAKKGLDWPVTMVVFFLQWPTDRKADFPAESVQTIRNAGAIPVITWEPMVLENGGERAVNADDILSGDWDGFLDEFARAARDEGGRIILRFAHEMNLARYHWGGDEAAYGPDSPARYQAMFRHVRGRFRTQGADNVLFAFCPNAESQPHPDHDNAAWNTVSAYYPGDDAVDVLGMDGYNWGTTFTKAKHGWDSRHTPFDDLFSPLRKELRKLAPAKPLVVFETACVAQGGDKADWIAHAVSIARDWGLAALCWFQVNKEQDWRLTTGVDASRLDVADQAFAPDAQAVPLPLKAGGRP